MKKVLFLIIILINFVSNAQVGIGTTSPHPSAALEIETTNKGFLAPRVALTSNSDVTTIASPATGLMILQYCISWNKSKCSCSRILLLQWFKMGTFSNNNS